jgi:hypothetical protein
LSRDQLGGAAQASKKKAKICKELSVFYIFNKVQLFQKFSINRGELDQENCGIQVDEHHSWDLNPSPYGCNLHFLAEPNRLAKWMQYKLC